MDEVTREQEEYWAARIADGQARVVRLQARMAAGEGEAGAAHAEGFLTRRDVDARVMAAVASLRRGAR